jgi:hypothetical protein
MTGLGTQKAQAKHLTNNEEYAKIVANERYVRFWTKNIKKGK